jgi:hypothetical protein
MVNHGVGQLAQGFPIRHPARSRLSAETAKEKQRRTRGVTLKLVGAIHVPTVPTLEFMPLVAWTAAYAATKPQL